MVDRKLKAIYQYGGEAAALQLNRPEHLAEVGRNGQKLVVDKERVLVLSPRLDNERTLILRPPTSEDQDLGWRRFCYSKSSGQLIVSWGGWYVYVYKVT